MSGDVFPPQAGGRKTWFVMPKHFYQNDSVTNPVIADRVFAKFSCPKASRRKRWNDKKVAAFHARFDAT
jgi:hypothetical protein